MSSTEKKAKYPTKKINVIITGNEIDGFSFIYEAGGESCECVIVNGPCYLEYTIKDSSAQQDYEFAFNGVAFSNPFNNVITEATIIKNGQTIVLTNPYNVCKSTSDNYSVNFQFGFSFRKNPNGKVAKNLLLLSADPEVVNENDIGLPGGH
ncbi:DP-EP family protein [Gallaecimonas pentaromativorans]|uniref:DP-EP family protein n=1 Tax=Gallaecimonas pentaromativorans TaxID=584787 RepID=UPI003A90A3BD